MRVTFKEYIKNLKKVDSIFARYFVFFLQRQEMLSTFAKYVERYGFEDASDSKPHDKTEFFRYGFRWNATPEGYDFWEDMDTQWFVAYNQFFINKKNFIY